MPRSDEQSERRIRALKWTALAVSPFATREAICAALPDPRDWPLVVAAADTGFLLPELSLSVNRHGLDRVMPAELCAFLDTLFLLNAERRAQLRGQMVAVSQILTGAGLQPIWIKGATTLIGDDFARSGRVMHDLDVWLVGDEQQQAALRLLAEAGCVDIGEHENMLRAWSHHHPPLQHPDWPARIEVHRRPIKRMPAPLVTESELASAVLWSHWEGGATGTPDAMSGALLSLAHATVMADASFQLGSVSLMKSLDFVARIARDFGGALPPAMQARIDASSMRVQANRMLTFMADYYDMPPPVRCDRGYIAAVERGIRRPRLNAVIGGAIDIVTRRLARLAFEPDRIPSLLKDGLLQLVQRRPSG